MRERTKEFVTLLSRDGACILGTSVYLGSLRGDLGVQFAEDCLPERVEILCHRHEGSGAADHVVAVIGIKATRRIGVRGIPRPLFGQDDETVDGDPFGKRLVARVGDGAAVWCGGWRGTARGRVAPWQNRCHR